MEEYLSKTIQSPEIAVFILTLLTSIVVLIAFRIRNINQVLNAISSFATQTKIIQREIVYKNFCTAVEEVLKSGIIDKQTFIFQFELNFIYYKLSSFIEDENNWLHFGTSATQNERFEVTDEKKFFRYNLHKHFRWYTSILSLFTLILIIRSIIHSLYIDIVLSEIFNKNILKNIKHKINQRNGFQRNYQ